MYLKRINNNNNGKREREIETKYDYYYTNRISYLNIKKRRSWYWLIRLGFGVLDFVDCDFDQRVKALTLKKRVIDYIFL